MGITPDTSIPVDKLVEIRSKAIRRRMWFKILDRGERAIVSLTIRCVKKIQSPKLAKIVTTIVAKLREAMKSRVKQMAETVGRSLAQKLSRIAQAWGNKCAIIWAEDPGFIQFLAIMQINTLMRFQT